MAANLAIGCGLGLEFEYYQCGELSINTDLDAECLDVVGAVRPPREVREVELDLVPAVIESHRHRTDKRLHTRRALVVAGAESPTHVLVVQNLVK